MKNEIEIILIEDNEDDAALALIALNQYNLSNKILHLKNGDEAFKFIYDGIEFDGRTFTNHPKAIFLDLKMPKVNGIEVLKRIKTDPSTKSIPVVILTSSAEDPDVKRCYDLGANSYIVKPIVFENFSKTVAQLGFYWAVLNKLE
jgi:two-component system, response regulator